MNIIKSDYLVEVDVDDTLVLWDISEFPASEYITVQGVNGPVTLVPHHKNIKTLIKFWKLGYTIVVHSHSGWEWATIVVGALKLQSLVHTVKSKARYYFDDQPIESFSGPRVYRNPKTGVSEK